MFNIFYMDTFFPLTERCMPWAWFIALKIQFYIISCLLMLLVELQMCYALIMGTSIILLSTIAASLWIWGVTHHYGYTTSLLYELTHFNLVADNICLFVIPYLLGIYLGHIIHRTNHNFHMNIFVFVTGWIIIFTLIGVYMFGVHFFMFHLNKWLKSIVSVLTHLMWNGIIFWIVLAAQSNYGDFIYRLLSFKYANALERLTPINVLIAPVIIRLILFTGDAPIYWSTGQISAMFMGCLLATYVCSLLLYVLLDGPLMAALESLLAVHKA
ncbi:uncharacterized protein [Musca autumnalis]|uniref:uncharacterized protein n=1 Tax=Musca autumnalis TaxID=221902 RepID=UPI003CF4E830